MGAIGPAKILVVLLVALIVLGPEKLPQMARQIGRLWADFRGFREGLEAEVRGAFGEEGGDPLNYVRSTVTETFATASSTNPPAPSPEAPPEETAEADGNGTTPMLSPAPGSPGASDPVAQGPAPGPRRTAAPFVGELGVPPDDPGFN